MIDLGTGNNNKMCVSLVSLSAVHLSAAPADPRVEHPHSNWPINDKQEVSSLRRMWGEAPAHPTSIA